MLNCGMTQKDIADLLVSEVDWNAGGVIRKTVQDIRSRERAGR